MNVDGPREMFRKMKRTVRALRRFAFHPIVIFTVLQIVIVAATVMWVLWYIQKNPYSGRDSLDLVFLITGCVLSGITLIGTVFLFVFAINQARLSRQQRTFVSSVTHELRSPLASMQLAIETMTTRELPQDLLSKNFKLMETDLKRLLSLVDQILVSARLDRGIRLFEEVEDFSLAELIEESLSSLVHKDPDLYSRCSLSVDRGLYIRTAKPALRLILDNLVDNALKYSAPGSPISISACVEGSEISIKIKDQGHGIDKRDMRRIFRLFQRGRGVSRRAIAGTGLGLYIVRTVVKNLGGRIKVESDGLAKGSQFTIQIPVNFQ